MEWVDFALLGSALISWVAVAMALFCLLKVRRQASITERLYKRLNHDLQLANSGSIGMGRRLVAMERKLHSTSDQLRFTNNELQSTSDRLRTTAARQEQLENQGEDFQSYNRAAELLSSGVAAEDVAKRCGLSRAEASLMQLMHSHVQGAVAA